jgi:hypothetical protein
MPSARMQKFSTTKRSMVLHVVAYRTYHFHRKEKHQGSKIGIVFPFIGTRVQEKHQGSKIGIVFPFIGTRVPTAAASLPSKRAIR